MNRLEVSTPFLTDIDSFSPDPVVEAMFRGGSLADESSVASP